MMMLNNTRVYNYIIILILTLSVLSCKLSKPYERPDLKSPAEFYGTGTRTDSIDEVKIRWTDFFSDSLLHTLIDSAIINNLDLQIANAYMEVADVRRKQARANFLPSVDFRPFNYRRDIYSENYNNYNSNRARRFYEGETVPQTLYTERMEYESSLAMSWELDIWGKLSAQKRASQLAYLKTNEFRKAVQTNMVAEIANSYFNLVLLKAQIEIYEDNLTLNDNTLKIVKLQYEAGEVTSLAVKQTLSQKLRAQTLIPRLQRKYIEEENKLNFLLGRQSESIALDNIKLPSIEEVHAAGMPLELINNRPDVAAAEFKLRESYEKVGIANAMRYPSISLGTGIGLNSFEFDKLLNPLGSGFLLLNGIILQPIFKNRVLKSNYEVALNEKKIAELEFKSRFLNAMNEISNALITLDKLKEEYQIAIEREVAAKKSVKDANYLFKSGLANYLEVITAQREALDSELNLESIKVQIYLAKVNLYRSLGGGWD